MYLRASGRVTISADVGATNHVVQQAWAAVIRDLTSTVGELMVLRLDERNAPSEAIVKGQTQQMVFVEEGAGFGGDERFMKIWVSNFGATVALCTWSTLAGC